MLSLVWWARCAPVQHLGDQWCSSLKVCFPFRYHAGRYLAARLPLVCHRQGLPRLYGDLKSQSLFPVYRTHVIREGSVRQAQARALYSIHYSQFRSQASGRARASGTPDTRLHACRRECTAVLPAAWRTGGYSRLGVGYTLKYLPAGTEVITFDKRPK